MNRNKNRIMIITFDTETGSATYRLPYENALTLISEILKTVPSITIYDNDHRNNLRNYYRHHRPSIND